MESMLRQYVISMDGVKFFLPAIHQNRALLTFGAPDTPLLEWESVRIAFNFRSFECRTHLSPPWQYHLLFQ